jgi:transcriptional regulator with XRE-family HTH domain
MRGCDGDREKSQEKEGFHREEYITLEEFCRGARERGLDIVTKSRFVTISSPLEFRLGIALVSQAGYFVCNPDRLTVRISNEIGLIGTLACSMDKHTKAVSCGATPRKFVDLWLFCYHTQAMHTKFGALLKEKRIEKELTLRDCCKMLEVDPSNWSKIERNINTAPKEEVLGKWADFFDLAPVERQLFFDLAAISRQSLPPDLLSDDEVAALLPVFFRGVRGDQASLDSLVAQIRALHARG